LLPSLLLVVTLGCARDRLEVTPTKNGVDGTCPEPPPAPAPTAAAAPARPVPTFEGKLLLPPATPSEAEGARYPTAASARAQGAAAVRVNPMGKGVIVSHELSHACCLQANVTTRLEAGTVVMQEELSGTPCRCTCASTVRTAIGLPPGRYTLSVRQAQGGDPKVVHEEPFTVEAAAP
ncbi:MAG TPA: hypothetical protein VK447_04030, partial [Myxococcaceae bacterium]|nr:hypothetical protein [Myxococcaceae bacterium]